jgi:predicted ATPase/DNA-binding SARP family transcriptional activator
VEIRVLGPIEVVSDDGPVRLAAPMHRRLLAALVLGVGEARSPDALIDVLWGASPPASAPKLLQHYVSQLRKVLPPPASIRTREAGYLLEVDGDFLDTSRFNRLLAEGSEALNEGNPALAASLLTKALGLWRGAPYADVGYEDFARAEADRLEELRQVAIEERVEAGLALGRHEELLAELSSLAAIHPLRERLQAQTMLALYRCGRQAEALELYATFRARLHDELGLEPGRELRNVQRRILQHDSSLGPPSTQDEPDAFLPTSPNALLGRGRELAELRTLLVRGDARLLVLTGAGGSGKTRLALEAARETASSFANGAVLVDLAPLRNPELVLGEISRVLGIGERAGEDVLETLAAALHPRELLLVLDNAEHLRAAAPTFVELITGAPRLTLLVTSRVVLHVSGEHVYPIDPLDEAAARELFMERAREADSRFTPTEEDVEAIHGICARLDGLPLAIELAASWVRALTPTELLARLDARLPLLTGGPHDLPARQQTLRATIEWSVELLDSDDVRDLNYLAVFAGGCTLDAAETVCGTTAERLSSLIDHSLVKRTTTASGSRYSMLETIREYAADRLEVSGEIDVRRQHADYFRALAEQAEGELEGAMQGSWFDTLEAELDNIRAALEWDFGGGDPETGARLASSLWRFWYLRGRILEGSRWLDRALAADFEPSRSLEQKLLKAAAILAQQLGDLEKTSNLTGRRLRLARTAGDQPEIAACLNNLGLIAWARGDLRQAEELFRESVSTYGSLGDGAWLRNDVPLGNLAWIAFSTDDLEGAERLAYESMAFARKRSDPEQIVAMNVVVILIRIEQGRMDGAIALQRETIRLTDQLDSAPMFAACCMPLAVLLARLGQLECAARVLGKRTALAEQLRIQREWLTPHVLSSAEEQAQRGLGEEAYLKAMTAGANADVRELLAAALTNADVAALAPDGAS